MSNTKKWNELFSKKHLREHFNEKIKMKASVGLDKNTVYHFEDDIESELDIIERKVLNGSYRFTRYRQVLFSKGAGKPPRLISVPTVRDKLVSSTLNEFLGYVYGDNCKSSLPQVIISDIQQEINNYDYYIKIDISKFYSSINHSILMRIIRRKIRKKEVIALIENAISTETISLPIKEHRSKLASEIGVPEGLPISNALANIYMSDIDKKYGDNSRIKYYRYVDDILILANELDYINIQKELLADTKRLKLVINRDKIEKGLTSDAFSYLGYQICSMYTTVRQSSVFRLENSIEDLIKESKRNNINYIEWKLNLKITGFILDDNKYGWMFFYSQITDTTVLHHLDWVVEKILKRYDLNEKIKVKKYVRTYYEITKRLHVTRYIPNIDNFSLDDKRKILSEIYGEKIEDLDDSKLESTFRKIMRREIQDIERDVEHFS